MIERKYGWKPSLPDWRDLKFTPEKAHLAVPQKIDLRDKCPFIYDQQNYGSCTSNGWAALFEFNLLKQGLVDFMPSRMQIYYDERKIEGTIATDAGAQIRTGAKVVSNIGVVSESDWGYTETNFRTEPPPKYYLKAKENLVQEYSAVNQTLYDMQVCLFQGQPIIGGFSVYESFENQEVTQTGIANLPSSTERSVGGHCIVIVGYDNSTQRFIVRNSWGDQWGMRGYFTIPYDYFLNPDLADDFWMISKVI